jgi:hypothetical protein
MGPGLPVQKQESRLAHNTFLGGTVSEMEKRFEYEFSYWRQTIGFEPRELIASVDCSSGYDKDELHVFKLSRGYAIVNESGCSCYSSSDADIDIVENLAAVKRIIKNNTDSYTSKYKEMLELLNKRAEK